MSGIAEQQHGGETLGDARSHRAAPHHQAAVRSLELELKQRKARRWWRVLVGLSLAALLVFATSWWQTTQKPPAPPRFVMAEVELRDISETVESSGRLRPVTEVQVGTQVSGRVVEVHVDFNTRVKKGDLLAEVDPSLFGAQVQQAAGQLSAARAQAERAGAARRQAKLRLDRMQKLESESLASRADLDDALNAVQLAEADLVGAHAQIQGLTAQLKSANTTLGYTRIHSPIDGIVISRAVDPGQTVAASFSAPVLFVIAQNLAEMQVLADIDEADVGKIREGMIARVSVDAFPGEVFEGTVTQIRYSPNEVQGVVTYAAVLDVSNEALKLRPGMTATVSITAHQVKGRLAVRNAAVRFKPADPKSVGDTVELKHGQRRVYVPEPESTPAASNDSGTSDTGQASEPSLKALIVPVGISDGVWTALEDDTLKVGSKVVIQERSSPEEQRRKCLGLF
jgi:HlyD family secretion protein